MQVLRAGALYFTVVFGTGFVLGAIRTLWVVRRLGTRMAELLEAPIMLVVMILASRWTVLWLTVSPALSVRLAVVMTDLPYGYSIERWGRDRLLSQINHRQRSQSKTANLSQVL
jgi:hypothetical protein